MVKRACYGVAGGWGGRFQRGAKNTKQIAYCLARLELMLKCLEAHLYVTAWPSSATRASSFLRSSAVAILCDVFRTAAHAACVDD
jgi:hypothetical protein